MRVLKVFLFLMFVAVFPLFGAGDSLSLDWDKTPNRQWVGADFWANRLQDWEVKDHKVYCTRPGINSTMHLLSAEIVKDAAFSGSIRLGRNAVSMQDTLGKSGLILGLSDTALNYLARSTMQHFFLQENGVWIGINEKKQLCIEEILSGRKVVSPALYERAYVPLMKNGLPLNFAVERKNDSMLVSLFIGHPTFKEYSIQLMLPLNILNGNITFIANSSLYGSEYFFDDFSVSGEAISVKNERQFGPISTCLYSLIEDHSGAQNRLNLSVQLMPLGLNARDSVQLELWSGEKWMLPVDTFLGQARLRDAEWNYMGPVQYKARLKRGSFFEGNYYEGIISVKRYPKDKLKIGVLSCNGMPFIERSGMDYWQIWKPYELTAKKYEQENPDLVVFLGDQMYESRPVPMEWNKKLYPLDYQYRWLMWCLQFNNITRKIPSLIMMDDHDYFQGNLWGGTGDTISKNSAHKMPSDFPGDETDWLTENGGFVQDTNFLKYAVNLQTGHMPPTYGQKNKPVPDYYCAFRFQGVSLAFLEDRKYKSSPLKVLPNVESFNGYPFSDSIPADSLYSENGQLLNSTQLKMMEKWNDDSFWPETMKIVFTQSVYASLSSVRKGYHPVSGKNITIEDAGKVATHLSKDMDSNGWPKSGRDTALKIIRQSGALLVGGDQHFPSIVHQGVENWKDASYAFTVPAISNSYPRFWLPDSADNYGGNNYIDGFGNKISMVAYANPVKNDSLPLWLNYAPGLAFVTCDQVNKSYIMDCWDFATDQQYSGWPLTVKVMDNIYSSSSYTTQKIKVKGIHANPWIEVMDGESLLYVIQTNNQPLRVPRAGEYKLIIRAGFVTKVVKVKTGKGSVKVKFTEADLRKNIVY